MKKLLCFLAVFALFLLTVISAFSEDVNLIRNGSFETITSSGKAEGWYENSYYTQVGSTFFSITTEKAHSGQYSAKINSVAENDARYIITISVEPNSLYRFSAWVWTEGMDPGSAGANLAVEDFYCRSNGVYNTNEEWQLLEWYGETSARQHEVTLGIRVGGYGSLTSGTAWFDDVSLEKIDSLPDGVCADVWYYEAPAQQEPVKSSSTSAPVLEYVLIALCFLILLYVYNRYGLPGWMTPGVILIAGVFIAALLRIILAFSIEGYEVDINCFTAWSLRIVEGGPQKFYSADYFCDYPPGYILMLWPVGLLLKSLSTPQTSSALFCVKLLPMFFDFAGAFILYCYLKKQDKPLSASVAAVLYLLSPVVILDSSCWGQADSVLAFFILCSCILSLKKKWHLAIPVYTAAILIKPQALLFGPVALLWLICEGIESGKKKNWSVYIKTVLGGIGISIIITAAVILPFISESGLAGIIDLYASTLASYSYITINTANLYYILGYNWSSLSTQVPWWMTIAPAVCCLCVSAICFFRKKRLTVPVSLTAATSLVFIALFFLKASFETFGTFTIILSFIPSFLLILRKKTPEKLPFALALALICLYTIGIKMHERYIFTALILLLLTWGLTEDRRLLRLFGLFSATVFINVAVILANSIRLGASGGHLNADTAYLADILSILNICAMAYAVWLSAHDFKKSVRLEKQAANDSSAAAAPFDFSGNSVFKPSSPYLRLNKVDLLIMLAVTLLYSAVTFTNLGSTKAPQTGWTSTSEDEYIVFSLPESREFNLLYFAGVSHSNFSVSVSDDGNSWSKAYPCEMREGLCYQWKYVSRSNGSEENINFSYSPSTILLLKGKYIRINAMNPGLNLLEIIARDPDGNVIPLSVEGHYGSYADDTAYGSPLALIDEQNTCEGEPGWFNSMYFDEIYHARTAYEHLHGQRPYETTHPPLGKLIMSVGIAIFGMTPFGWRFSGALIGVLMLPVIYLLATQIFHRRSAGIIAISALALDLMHFTQTRIATIDSYPVFFIMLSYLFMIRYIQCDHFENAGHVKTTLLNRSLIRELLPLLLSGICMGLSIASKWIGCYSAVGLAVLFFSSLIKQALDLKQASGIDTGTLSVSDSKRLENARQFFLTKTLVVCASCVLFFVLIPVLIYCLSYIPYLSPSGPVTLGRIWNAQIGMMNYHSTPGLGMDHPFQARWWQWPFISKPMWFAQDSYEITGFNSTIMCMGNPAVFFTGACCIISVLVACIWHVLRNFREQRIVYKEDFVSGIYIGIGFLAQFLPWVLVSRSTYIYHYFASIPFIILATAWVILRIRDKRVRILLMAGYIFASLVCFILYYPYASGCLTSNEWLDAVRLFFRLYY